MGYMVHHAVLVTSWDRAALEQAHAMASSIYEETDELGSLVSPIVRGVDNGEATFMVAPDGSKEGWETSNRSDIARLAFMQYLHDTREEDGSSVLKWCEVQYGDERNDNRMVRDNARPHTTIVAAQVASR